MIYKKIQKSIEIVWSTTPALSSMGRKSCDALYALLQAHYATVGATTVNTVADLDSVVAKQPDLVFTGMKHVPGALPGTKVWVSEYLDRHHIAHTGSPKDAIEAEQNKPLAKERVAAVGLKTARYAIVKAGDMFDAAASTLQFPLFIKPVNLGGGKGVDAQSVANTPDELHAKVTSLAADHGADALVEEFLPGREYSVAVLRDEYSDKLIAMPLELVAGPNAHGHRILSHELKTAPLETPVFPVTDRRVRAALIDLALGAFKALGARDYGRIDIRMNAAGVPHFLEANLIPCLIRGSGNFPKACLMNIGMDYEAMILHIVRLGLARSVDALDAADATDMTTSYSLAPTAVPA